MFGKLRNFLTTRRMIPARSDSDDADYKFITENSLDAILLLGPDGKMRYASPSCLNVFGRTAEEMRGGLIPEILHPEDIVRGSALKAQMISGAEKFDMPSFRIITPEGKVRWLEGTANAVRDAAGKPVKGFVVVLRDITEHKALEDQLAAQALTDGLTGLANRRAFDEALERIWAGTVTRGTRMSLLLLDIDFFKGFNDKYGHQVGDDCLRAVAAAVTQRLPRKDDFAARYGGEELAVILPDADEKTAVAIAEDLRGAVNGLRIPHEVNGAGAHCVSVSIGVATAIALTGGTMNMPAGLLAAADTALYKAKQQGRNQVATTLLLTSSNGVAPKGPSAGG